MVEQASRIIDRSANSWTNTADHSLLYAESFPGPIPPSEYTPHPIPLVQEYASARFSPSGQVHSTSASILAPLASQIISMNKRGYAPKSGDEKAFVDLMKVQKHADRARNPDSHFQGVTKTFNRKKNRQGYNPQDDQKAYFSPAGEKHPGVATEEALYETTHQKACDMAQLLADKDNATHFVHSFRALHPETGRPLKDKRYGVVSKQHYDSDPDKYKYHLTHIVHPTPPKSLKEATAAGDTLHPHSGNSSHEGDPKSRFEHLADAIGRFIHCVNSNIPNGGKRPLIWWGENLAIFLTPIEKRI